MNTKMQTTREFLLDVAKLAILMRDVVDGVPNPEYDCQQDPEGYVTSLLTALHHWCDAYGLDWESELSKSQECFEQDMVESFGKGVLEQPVLSNLKCPQCSHQGSFLIRVSQQLLMFSDGVELVGDEGEQWDGLSSCTCPGCGHSALVKQFIPEPEG